MKSVLYVIASCMVFLIPMGAHAQEVEMADQFRAEGKIYVVIAVFAIILAGLFVYLFSLDRKIGKLEQGRDQ
jgi:CcmD family protein